MRKTIFHQARRWPLAMALLLAPLPAPWLGLAAGLNEPVAAQTLAVAEAAGQATLVWIGAFPGGTVPMRPVEFVRQENGDLLVKGGAVVKAMPAAVWPVMRGGASQGHFFVLAHDNSQGGVYWIMDFAGQRPARR